MNAAKFDFSGAHVLVTGGSNGIGNAIAIAFREAGAAVAITGTRADGKYDTDIAGMRYSALDLRDAAATLALAQSLPVLDVLVNCAGLTAAGGKSEFDPVVFADTLDVNLTGSFRMANAVLPQLKQTKGSVINIASMTSYFSSPSAPAYGASKAGVLELTKSLADAWARHGVRVNAIAPGWIETNLAQPARANEKFSDRIVQRTPMRRWGVPRECAGTALYLASDAATFVTGATIPVDGGYSVT